MTTKQRKTADEIVALVEALPKDCGIEAYKVFAKLPLPFPMGCIKLVAEQLGIPRFRADQAASLRAVFDADPEARERLEDLVLKGAMSIHRALARARPEKGGATATLKPAASIFGLTVRLTSTLKRPSKIMAGAKRVGENPSAKRAKIAALTRTAAKAKNGESKK